MNKMGERIKQKRLELGLSGEELGQRLGVHRAAVNKWESGEVENIKRSTIAEMSRIFDCSPSWLMGFDSPTSISDALLSVSPKRTVDFIIDKDAQVLLEKYHEMSPESKKSLMDLAEFLLNKEKDVNQ